MARKRQIAALQLVSSIKQHELETIGVELSRLRAQQTDLAQQSARLSEQATNEISLSTAETRAYLPGYLSSVNKQQEGLAAESHALTDRIAALEENLFALFREVKTTQTVLAKSEAEAEIELQRAENADLDDVARTLFLQNADRT